VRFSFHRLAVENLWKTPATGENFFEALFSTAIHIPPIAALAEMWKTVIQISKNKQLRAIQRVSIVWKSVTVFTS